MEIVKTLEVGRPHPEIPDFSDFFAATVEEVAGSILVLGRGKPPLGYDRVTSSRGGVAIVARIDPDTLTVHNYKAEFAPGSKILDVVEVDGMAWLLNSWSHIPERPPRTDIYVIDPVTLEIVDSFNLPKPYPVWGKIGADGYVYIYHKGDFDAGEWGGVTRIDPVTRETEYTKINDPERGFSAWGFDVYRGQPCIVLRSGLWCMNDDGSIDLNLSQESSIGVLFAPSSGEAGSGGLFLDPNDNSILYISPAPSGFGVSVTMPEWTASAAAWVLAIVIDAARTSAPGVSNFAVRVVRV